MWLASPLPLGAGDGVQTAVGGLRLGRQRDERPTLRTHMNHDPDMITGWGCT